MAEMDALMREHTASGERIGREALADPAQAKIVRIHDSATVITDEPFAEAQEHRGGSLIVVCARPERATAIAQGWPNATFCARDVWPRMEQSGDGR